MLFMRILGFLSTLIAATLCFRVTPTSSFVWSDENALGALNSYSLDFTTPAAIARYVLYSLWGSDKNTQLMLISAKNFDEISIGNLDGMNKLEQIISHESASSRVFPHVFLDNTDINQESTLLSYGVEIDNIIPDADESTMGTSSAIAKKVSFDANAGSTLRDIDAFLTKLQETPRKSPLITVLTFEPNQLLSDSIQQDSAQSSVHRKLIYYGGDYQYVYMTPELLAALLTLIFFVVIVILGTWCLGNIQTPIDSVREVPPKGKEY